MLKNQKAQALIEYATITAIVTGALLAMTTYVYRSVQATQQKVFEESRAE